MLDKEITIQVIDLTGPTKTTMQLVVPTLQLTARELIRLRVHNEFTMAQLDYEKQTRLSGVPHQPNKSGVNTQFVWTSWIHKLPSNSTWEEAAEKACEDFTDGKFMIVIAGKQLEDLDTVVLLDQESSVQFIKLVPLVGG